MRRHALTHTIGGDLPAELNEGGSDSTNEKILIDDENDEPNDIDDEFDDIQVDSPVNERSTPSPVVASRKDVDDDESPRNERSCDDEIDGEPPRKMPRLEQKKDESELYGITHCHHNGGQMHYTMRPQQGAGNWVSDGKLHVRRDLHYKVDSPLATPASSSSTATAGNSIPVPFRKRSAGLAYENLDNEPSLAPTSLLVPLHATPLNLSNHSSTIRNPENSNGELTIITNLGLHKQKPLFASFELT